MARTEHDFATTSIEDLVDPSGSDAPGDPIPENTGIVAEDDSFPTEDHRHDPMPENTGIVAEDDSFPTEDHPHDPMPENTGIVAEDDSFPTDDQPHDPPGEVYSIVAEDDSFPTEPQDDPHEALRDAASEGRWEDFHRELEDVVEHEVNDALLDDGPEPVVVDELPDAELPPELIFVVDEPAPVAEPMIIEDLPDDGVVYAEETVDLSIDDGLGEVDGAMGEVDDWADVAL